MLPNEQWHVLCRDSIFCHAQCNWKNNNCLHNDNLKSVIPKWKKEITALSPPLKLVFSFLLAIVKCTARTSRVMEAFLLFKIWINFVGTTFGIFFFLFLLKTFPPEKRIVQKATDTDILIFEKYFSSSHLEFFVLKLGENLPLGGFPNV